MASAFDLVLDAKVLLAPQDVAYLLKVPPADCAEEDRRRAAYLARSGPADGAARAAPARGRGGAACRWRWPRCCAASRAARAGFLSISGGRRPDRALRPRRSCHRGSRAPGDLPQARQRSDRLRPGHGAGRQPHPLLAGHPPARRRAGGQPRGRGLRSHQSLQLLGALPQRFAAGGDDRRPLSRPGLSTPSRSSSAAPRAGWARYASKATTAARPRWTASPCAGLSTCPTPSSPPSG